MTPPDRDGAEPAVDAVCDGGDLDCGSGLLLIIRKEMAPLQPGGVLEVRSRESSVREDLPAWCRLVGHDLLDHRDGGGGYTRYFVRKKGDDGELAEHLRQARDHSWQARIRWSGGMAATAFVRNHAIPVGQPASFDTADAAPSAVEHLLAALGAALAVGMQWRLSQRGAEVRQLEVVLRARSRDNLAFLGVTDGDPALAGVEGKLYLDSDADPALAETLWQETLHRCPVARSLTGAVEVDIALRAT